MSGWDDFFNVYATRYDAESFTHHTEAEVRFLIEHLDLKPGDHLLDIGCGTGRHSVPLAAYGCRVTGVDLSDQMLALARRRAEQAGVQVEWVCDNALHFVRPQAFDAAICLCEGAMCLLTAEEDALEHDLTILLNLRASLRPGGRLILNVLNACRMIRAFNAADVAAGKFDPATLTERSDVAQLLGEDPPSLHLRERGYTPPELHRLLRTADFQVRGVHGGTAGQWALRPPDLDEMELMALAQVPLA